MTGRIYNLNMQGFDPNVVQKFCVLDANFNNGGYASIINDVEPLNTKETNKMFFKSTHD